MKKLPLLLLASMLTATTAARAETVLFEEGFSGSTVASATPAAPTATSTDYAVMSSKNATGSAIGSTLNLKLSTGTSAGFAEMQALFTTNPITLAAGEWITLEMTFQPTLLLDEDTVTESLNVGLYNSGGSYPVPGGQMANGGMGGGTAFVSGYAQNWQGYVGRVGALNGGNSSQMYTRDPQTDTTDENQDALFNNAGTGAFDNPTGQTIGNGDQILLNQGADYTLALTVFNDGTNILVSEDIYIGVGTIGVSVYSASGTAPSGYEYATFDSLAFGARFSAASAPSIDVSKLSVTKYTPQDLPALYNLQLNGFEANTMSGAAYIGSSGDLWNNPDWVGVPTGSTNLFTNVPLLDSTAADLGATVSMTAAWNNNTSAWNDGGAFNRYNGRTTGSATPVLMDQVVKVDYDYADIYTPRVNVMTLTFSGLAANKLVTVYVYGSGDGAGQGGIWSLGAANGGDSATIEYAGSATGRDVTLTSSQGTGWEVLSGTTDGSGNLVIVASNQNGAPPGTATWYQTYMNGLQLQVGGVAPAIFDLTDQTVEDGTTVNLTPAVTGNPTPNYQWYENGSPLGGETGPGLMLASVTTNQNGNVYSLVAENALGVASNSMTLTVNASVYSTMSVTAVSPINGATGICYDTPLTVTFSDTISLGTIGSVKIFDASNPGTPVDTINAADGLAQQRNFPGDGQSFTYPTFTISGNTVTINPHFNVLTSNKTYYVTIDPKTFLDSGGTNFVGLSDTNAWQFSTKSAPADADNLVVNGDGSGDFLTVQGAVNSVPGGNTIPRNINVRDGLYHEIVNIAGKHNITLQGESRTGTLVGFENNATYQAANGGTTHARMSFKVNADDITLDSLTLTNMTPQGGSQAESLMIETGAARCIVNNCEIVSRQDTILANTSTSQCYFNDSTIKGNFDYIWGGGNLFFTNCNIHTISGSSGFNVTAARTSTSGSYSTNFPWLNPGGTYTANGMSFVNCSFTADSGVTTVTLAGHNGTAGNNVSWFGCDFSPKYVAPGVEFGGNYLWWQSDNTQNAAPVSFANVTSYANTDAEMVAATNVTIWLYGWTPVLTPNQPAISDPTVLPDGNFEFDASGDNGQSYRAWASDDITLTPVTSTWTEIGSGTFGVGPETITDLDATNHPLRFYLITIP